MTHWSKGHQLTEKIFQPCHPDTNSPLSSLIMFYSCSCPVRSLLSDLTNIYTLLAMRIFLPMTDSNKLVHSPDLLSFQGSATLEQSHCGHYNRQWWFLKLYMSVSVVLCPVQILVLCGTKSKPCIIPSLIRQPLEKTQHLLLCLWKKYKPVYQCARQDLIIGLSDGNQGTCHPPILTMTFYLLKCSSMGDVEKKIEFFVLFTLLALVKMRLADKCLFF